MEGDEIIERTKGTLIDLLDRILDKGIIINADILVMFAGIPLIAITLRGAIASIETMLDYGMMEAWDKNTREWYIREHAGVTKNS